MLLLDDSVDRSTPLFTSSIPSSVSYTQGYVLSSALVVTLWDYGDSLPSEYAYIWRKRNGFIKLVYMAIRYLNIVFQIGIFFSSLHLNIASSNASSTASKCKRWIAFQSFAMYTIYILVYGYNMRRAYNLHLRSKKVLYVLLTVAILEAVVTLTLVPISMSQLVMDGNCNSTNIPPTVFCILAAKIFSQFMTWILTYLKLGYRDNYSSATNHFKWTRLIIYAVLIFLPVLSTRNKYIRPDLMFPWPMALVSMPACRMIIRDAKDATIHQENLHEMPVDHPVHSSLVVMERGGQVASYNSALSLVAIRSAGYVVPIANSPDKAAPVLTGTLHRNGLFDSVHSLPASARSRPSVDPDFKGSISEGSLADDERSLEDRIEVGSAHTCSSFSSEDQFHSWIPDWVPRSSSSRAS